MLRPFFQLPLRLLASLTFLASLPLILVAVPAVILIERWQRRRQEQAFRRWSNFLPAGERPPEFSLGYVRRPPLAAQRSEVELRVDFTPLGGVCRLTQAGTPLCSESLPLEPVELDELYQAVRQQLFFQQRGQLGSNVSRAEELLWVSWDGVSHFVADGRLSGSDVAWTRLLNTARRLAQHKLRGQLGGFGEEHPRELFLAALVQAPDWESVLSELLVPSRLAG